MYIGFPIIGFIIGLMVMAGSEEMFGALAGAGLGLLLAHLAKLQRRVKELELKHKWLRQFVSSRSEREEPLPARSEPEAEPPPGPQQPADWQVTAGPPSEPELEPVPEAAAHPGSLLSSGLKAEPVDTGPSAIQKLIARVASWFTTGNVPVKVGVLLSFIGVAFFLKYALDNELFTLPIEFRLLAVAAGGIVMTVVGWRLRERLRVYALSLQGGGCGILFLTIFAAYRIWELLPAGLTFVLLVALAAFTGALSVLQKSRWLIILGAAGGFLAPVLASTGQGSHVALFSYYLVLNAGILGVSWFRAWRSVNLVGFVFTFVIGSFWGYRYYKPHLFASTEPFLVLHFLFYQAIAILYALRQPGDKVGLVDGTLVFGTPVIAFALQAALVRNFEYGLAISAAVLATFYALTATWLQRRKGAHLRVLTESFIALAVAFATIAVPLALDARWTAAAWALEGAALIWIATRQPQHLANLAGAALILFSGFAFMIDGWRHDSGLPVLNGNVLGGVLISISALFAARRLENFARPPLGKVYPWIAWGLFGWGVLWWLATGAEEIDDRLARTQALHAFLLFLTASAGGFAWLGKARDWNMARLLTHLFMPAMGLMALNYAESSRHFLAGLGWLAWPLAFALQAQLLRMMDRDRHSLAAAWHLATAVLLTWLLSVEVSWKTGVNIAGAWNEAAASAIPGIMALLIWRFRERPLWPVPEHPVGYRALSLVLVGVQTLYLAVASVALPGDPGRLPYLPVLNPFDLAMLFCAVAALLSLVVMRRDSVVLEDSPVPAWMPAYRIFQGVAFFVLTTAALLRGVHYLAGVPWDFDDLFESVIAQTALSIYWGVLGFAGMIWGARSARRWVWLGGAGFMGLVVIKLFLVDLGNSGTIERIISFIGIGVLLLVVGYFAPVPPRQAEEAQ